MCSLQDEMKQEKLHSVSSSNAALSILCVGQGVAFNICEVESFWWQ